MSFNKYLLLCNHYHSKDMEHSCYQKVAVYVWSPSSSHLYYTRQTGSDLYCSLRLHILDFPFLLFYPLFQGCYINRIIQLLTF